MQIIKSIIGILIFIMLTCPCCIWAQNKVINPDEITRQEIAALTNEDLMSLDFETLLA